MSNFNTQIFESYNLPFGYSIKKAEAADIFAILKYEWFANKILVLFWASIYPIGIFISLPGGYSEWKVWHRSIVFETGIETLSQPDLAGWLYILFEAAKFALIFPIICIFSSLVTFCSICIYWQLLDNLDKRNPIPHHWIVKYKGMVVGQARSIENISCLKLNSLSIHPRHRNRGIGSYLLWTAIKDINKPVYLQCTSGMQSFYRRFGFVSVSHRETPVALKPAFGYKVMKLS